MTPTYNPDGPEFEPIDEAFAAWLDREEEMWFAQMRAIDAKLEWEGSL